MTGLLTCRLRLEWIAILAIFSSVSFVEALARLSEPIGLKGIYLGMTLEQARKIEFPGVENIYVSPGDSIGPMNFVCTDDDLKLQFPNAQSELSMVQSPFYFGNSNFNDCKYAAIEHNAFSNESGLKGFSIGFAGTNPSRHRFNGDDLYVSSIIYTYLPKHAPDDEQHLGQIDIKLSRSTLERVLVPFVSRFGAPDLSESKSYKNDFGQVIRGDELYWVGDKGAILIQEYDATRNQSLIRFRSFDYNDIIKRRKNSDAQRDSEDF